MMDKRLRNRLGKVGFVLGSGGAKGAWMAGNFLAFKEFGIFPDFIASCSVGSLNAIPIVMHQDLGQTSEIWRKKIKGPRDIFRKNPANKGRVLSDIMERTRDLKHKRRLSYFIEATAIGAKVLLNYSRIKNTPSILSSEPLEKLINQWDYSKIINSQVEFEMICAHKKTNRKTVFSNRIVSDPEIMRRATMASISISGVFPPVDIFQDGELYVDGATADPLPIFNALEKKCKTIFLFCLHPENREIKVDENSKQDLIWSLLPESAKSYLSMQDAQSNSYETNITNISKYLPSEVYVLRPQLIPKGIETLFINEEDRDMLIEDGYRSAKRFLKYKLNLVPS